MEVLPRLVELVASSYGYTTNAKGYKVLNPKVGVIYGDSLTEVDIKNSLELLKVNGYSAEASVFRKKLPVLNLLTVDGHWANIDPHLTVGESDYIFRKVVPSAFFDSPLRQLLTNLEVDSVVVCGFSTSGCVRATAVDALQSNFSVVIPSDACGDRDIEAHNYNLRDLGLKTGDVMSTAELLNHVK
jgi:nicotinamidase-related amidase